MAKYYSTKTYGHNIDLKSPFIIPYLLHGYSLQFKFTFGCDESITKIGQLILRVENLNKTKRF